MPINHLFNFDRDYAEYGNSFKDLLSSIKPSPFFSSQKTKMEKYL